MLSKGGRGYDGAAQRNGGWRHTDERNKNLLKKQALSILLAGIGRSGWERQRLLPYLLHGNLNRLVQLSIFPCHDRSGIVVQKNVRISPMIFHEPLSLLPPERVVGLLDRSVVYGGLTVDNPDQSTPGRNTYHGSQLPGLEVLDERLTV